MSRDKFKDLKDYDDVLLEQKSNEMLKTKDFIGKTLQSDIKVKPKNESQKKLINSIRNNEITICSGHPGSGKTFVSVAYSLSLLRNQNNNFKTIYLVKSVTTLKGEEIGFLKGDLKDKIEPFMWSFYINMEKIIPKEKIDSLIAKDIIKPFPLAYMRGASLDNCIIIADEFQNVTIDNSKTFLTRIGNNCKIIVLGDIEQIDLKNKNESSLNNLTSMFENVDGIGVIKMSKEDTNVRNPLITTIEDKFKEFYISNKEKK